jgi:ADP-ribose pyrophosphatase
VREFFILEIKLELVETCVESNVVYDGCLLHVCRDSVRLPDGKLSVREYVTHPGAVAVLALLDNGKLIMERQYRYPARQEFIELPAGKIDHGEDILVTGQRELLEETGYTAREWVHLTTTWPCIGYADERIEYFLARGLTLQQRNLDEGEFLEVFELSLEEAIDWIRQGKINDSKTIVGIFWLEHYLKNWCDDAPK